MKAASWSQQEKSPKLLGDCGGTLDNVHVTGPRQQVLRGYTWQVQGTNGSNSAPPSHPRGSTLTFQREVGVSWVLGLRHGVTMHPRGRHLREDMTLLSTWRGHSPEREKQPPFQPTQPPLKEEEQEAMTPRKCKKGKNESERTRRRSHTHAIVCWAVSPHQSNTWRQQQQQQQQQWNGITTTRCPSEEVYCS